MLINGNDNAIFTVTGNGSDTTMPCLALNYSLGSTAGEDPSIQYRKATFTAVAAGGDTNSKLELLVTLVAFDETGAAGTNLTYTIEGGAAKIAWAGTSPTFTATALTIKDVVDLLNEIPGIQAFAMHIPHSWSVNTATWIAVSATDVPTQPAKYLETLFRDYSANELTDAAGSTDHEVFFMRVGVPEMRDAGTMRLIGLDVNATGTAPNVKLYRDDIRDFSEEYNATFYTELLNKQMYVNTAVVSATQTKVVDNTILDAPTIRGPVIVQIDQSDLTTCVATLTLQQVGI